MTKVLVILNLILVASVTVHLQFQIDTIKESSSWCVQTFGDASRELDQTRAGAGGGPFIDADYGFVAGEAPSLERAEAMQTPHAGRSKELRQVYTNGYIDPDLLPIAPENNEPRNIGEQLSVDDISAYENFDAEALSIGAFVDADSPYR